MKIHLALSGRNYDATGSLPQELELADGASVADALDALARLIGAGRELPPSALVALSGTHLGTLRSYNAQPLREGDELLLIMPVAGG
jgi:molybdopterin converting factor small subunit